MIQNDWTRFNPDTFGFSVRLITIQKREQKAKGECMYVCGAHVILHFTQLDPLNPKPITEDLPNALPQPPYWRLGWYTQPAARLPLARSLVISSGASLPIGCFKVLSVSLTGCHPGLCGENPSPQQRIGKYKNASLLFYKSMQASNHTAFKFVFLRRELSGFYLIKSQCFFVFAFCSGARWEFFVLYIQLNLNRFHVDFIWGPYGLVEKHSCLISGYRSRWRCRGRMWHTET